MHKEKDENGMLSHLHHHDTYRSRELGAFEHALLDGDMFLQVSTSFITDCFNCDFFISCRIFLVNISCLWVFFRNVWHRSLEEFTTTKRHLAVSLALEHTI